MQFSDKFEFLVSCVSVSRLQSSGKPHEWKPYSVRSVSGCDRSIWRTEAQQILKSPGRDQRPTHGHQVCTVIFNYHTNSCNSFTICLININEILL